MDVYSNILYVKEQFAALSHLAHRVASADKYRPETCCIIGNYYSLKGQHEKVRRMACTLYPWHTENPMLMCITAQPGFVTCFIKGTVLLMLSNKVHVFGTGHTSRSFC